MQSHYLSQNFPPNSAFVKKEGKRKIHNWGSAKTAFLRQRCFSISMASSCCLQSMGHGCFSQVSQSCNGKQLSLSRLHQTSPQLFCHLLLVSCITQLPSTAVLITPAIPELYSTHVFPKLATLTWGCLYCYLPLNTHTLHLLCVKIWTPGLVFYSSGLHEPHISIWTI